jgi:hypothetical protein
MTQTTDERRFDGGDTSRIEALQAEVERLRKALTDISKGRHVNAKGEIENLPSYEAQIARDALDA